VRGAFGRRRIAWDDIDYYTYWSALSSGTWKETPAAVDSPAVFSARHSLQLYGRRTSLTIGSSFRDVQRAVGLILPRVNRQLRARTTIDVYPFSLDDAGLTHAKRGTLGWSDVEKVVLNYDGQLMRVMKHDKTFAWCSERLAWIHNGLLLLELLVERGVRLDPGPAAFVTRQIIDGMARAAALPRAEVRRIGPGPRT
jgi:hypothetical protein